jgi:hypothetical protein
VYTYQRFVWNYCFHFQGITGFPVCRCVYIHQGQQVSDLLTSHKKNSNRRTVVHKTFRVYRRRCGRSTYRHVAHRHAKFCWAYVERKKTLAVNIKRQISISLQSTSLTFFHITLEETEVCFWAMCTLHSMCVCVCLCVYIYIYLYRGRVSSVGMATRYGLGGPGIESRWGARFSVPVHTSPWAHPASYTVGNWSFPGVKRRGRDVDHPAHLAPRLKKSRAIPLLHRWAFVACSRVNQDVPRTIIVSTKFLLSSSSSWAQQVYCKSTLVCSKRQTVETRNPCFWFLKLRVYSDCVLTLMWISC